ncbi:hypothetical protein [Arthrobacter globiformis]|uniref:hypothetical protein n=1 Tax=Arthrobacter globiformis TaxID=1665 RepID=UPI00277F66FD|nr:hypothetical protein [Arthrobacter globiformis]MDQ0862942.1 putative membrane protein [Arthrobacter globiformis]
MTAVPAGTASWSSSGTGAQAPARPAVPWLTVIPLAAMMAYADGFWMVSLRGAVGAIERTQEPFASWLRESTVLLPVFVLAVIAAVTLALRWFGPVLAGRKAFFTTALLIAAAGTLAGTATLAVSEAWDYALQHDLMGTLHHASSVQSVRQLDQASLGLQLAAFGYGAGLLLATNIVVTGWTVAIRGGRLDVSRQQKATPERTPRRMRAGRARTGATDLSATGLRQMLAAVALFGCAAIHLAVIPDHLNHWVVASAFFLALAMAEIACGVLLLGRAGLSVLVAAAAAAVVPLALWVWSRTSGLPFGPNSNVPEPVGLADVAAGLLELGTLVIAVVLLRAGRGGTVRPAGRTAASAHLRALAVVGAIAVGSLGVGGAVPGWLGELPRSGDITHGATH